MSVKQMGIVWELKLPHNQAWVLMAMADHAHDDGTECRAGVTRLAWKTGYGERQVRRVLHELREDGIIEAVAWVYGGKRPTKYTLHLDRAAKKPPLTYEVDPPVKMSSTPGATVRTPVTVKSSEPSLTINQPSGEPSVHSDTETTWLRTLRAIDGWATKGEPHIDSLVAWVNEKEWTIKELEASALGLATTSDKVLKGYRTMAGAFQRRLNQGYDRVPVDGRDPRADSNSTPTSRSAGWPDQPA